MSWPRKMKLLEVGGVAKPCRFAHEDLCHNDDQRYSARVGGTMQHRFVTIGFVTLLMAMSGSATAQPDQSQTDGTDPQSTPTNSGQPSRKLKLITFVEAIYPEAAKADQNPAMSF